VERIKGCEKQKVKVVYWNTAGGGGGGLGKETACREEKEGGKKTRRERVIKKGYVNNGVFLETVRSVPYERKKKKTGGKTSRTTAGG